MSSLARVLLGLGASVLTVLALGGCGGGSSTTSTTVTQTASSSGTATSSSSATTTGTGTHTTSAGTGLRRCVAAALSGSFLGQQGATGHGELGFALRNSSSRACHTFGYPGVQFLSASGQPLPTASTRTTHDFFGTAPAGPLNVGSGASVSFRLGVTHGVVPGSRCATAAALQVIPPDDTATLRIRIPGGAYECGTATVSPLRPGTSAYP